MKKNLSKAIQLLAETEYSSQTELAEAAGFRPSEVSRDIKSSDRNITDERLKKYLTAVSEEGRLKLITARILDMVPEEYHGLIWDGDAERLTPAWEAPPVSNELKRALEWIAAELTLDSELETAFLTFCRFSGLDPAAPSKEERIQKLPGSFRPNPEYAELYKDEESNKVAEEK